VIGCQADKQPLRITATSESISVKLTNIAMPDVSNGPSTHGASVHLH